MLFRPSLEKALFGLMLLAGAAQCIDDERFAPITTCGHCKSPFEAFKNGHEPVLGRCYHTICSSCRSNRDTSDCPFCPEKNSFEIWTLNNWATHFITQFNGIKEDLQPYLATCSGCSSEFDTWNLFLSKRNGIEEGYLELAGSEHIRISSIYSDSDDISVLENNVNLARQKMLCERCWAKKEAEDDCASAAQDSRVPYAYVFNEAKLIAKYQIKKHNFREGIKQFKEISGVLSGLCISKEKTESYENAVSTINKNIECIRNTVPQIVDYFAIPIEAWEGEFAVFGPEPRDFDCHAKLIREKYVEYLAVLEKINDVMLKHDRIVNALLMLDEYPYAMNNDLLKQFYYDISAEEELSLQMHQLSVSSVGPVFDFAKPYKRFSRNFYVVNRSYAGEPTEGIPLKIRYETMEISEFDVSRRRAALTHKIRVDRKKPGIFIKDDRLYVVFGSCVDGEENDRLDQSYDSIVEYNLKSIERCSSDDEDIPLPLPQATYTISSGTTPNALLCAVLEYNGKLYIAGGIHRDKYLSVVNEWDFEGEIKKSSDLNHPRASFVLIEIGGKMVAMGGYDGCRYVEEIEVFDEHTGTWTDYDFMRGGRAGMSATVVGKKVYIGGVCDGDYVHTFRDVMRSWSPKYRRWSAEIPMQSVGCGYAMETVDLDRPCILVYGGMDAEYGSIEGGGIYDPSAPEIGWSAVQCRESV